MMKKLCDWYAGRFIDDIYDFEKGISNFEIRKVNGKLFFCCLEDNCDCFNFNDYMREVIDKKTLFVLTVFHVDEPNNKKELLFEILTAERKYDKILKDKGLI
jgi:hypothetical protein